MGAIKTINACVNPFLSKYTSTYQVELTGFATVKKQ